jgi:hypothetical protein
MTATAPADHSTVQAWLVTRDTGAAARERRRSAA